MPWIGLLMQGAWLGFEAQQVIALRLAKLAAGGPSAQIEASRMVLEKLEAMADGQFVMMGAAMRGEPEQGVESLLVMYRRLVRANRLRLSGG
jgi:hypothetical protein